MFSIVHSCWVLFRNNLNSKSNVIVFALREDKHSSLVNKNDIESPTEIQPNVP